MLCFNTTMWQPIVMFITEALPFQSACVEKLVIGKSFLQDGKMTTFLQAELLGACLAKVTLRLEFYE